MPSEPSDGIFIPTRLLTRLIILYNAPFCANKTAKIYHVRAIYKKIGEMFTLPRCNRQPKVDDSLIKFYLITQSASNTRTSALCRALQSLYKPMTCNDHGSISAPVPPSSLGRFGHGCTRSAGGLIAVGNGGVDD